MKNIIGLVFLIISVNVFGQNPPGYQHRVVRERIQGSFMVDSGLHIPRYNGAPSGLRTGSSTQAGAIGMDTSNHLFKYYSGSVWRDVQPIRDGLYSGGIVTWDSLLVFTVSAAVYYIGGQRYETALTNITLDAADGSNPRIDLIVATTSGISKITGTAAASPAEANLPIDNIRLTAIYVNTAATIPTGPITKIIYDQNTEFTGAATSVTADFANTTDPYHFTIATSTGAVTSSSFITYTGTNFSISPFNTFKCFIKLKSAFANGTRFLITWYKDGVQVSTTLAINNNTYGYLRTSGSYQEITIPVADFGISVDTVDQVKIALSGSNGSGFYIDYIQLKGGVDQLTGGTRFGVSGEDAVATQARYFNAKNTHAFWLDSIPSFVLSAVNARFRNLAGSDWLSYLPATTGLKIDPLSTSIPLTISSLPTSDTATYVMGLTTGGRAVLQSKSVIKPSLNKGVFIAFPTSADIVDVWQTPVAITVTSLKAILRGSSPSVTYNIRFGTDITSATTVFTSDITCTSITTGCSNSSGFADATIPAGSFIWVYTTAASGTISSIAFTINYTED